MLGSVVEFTAPPRAAADGDDDDDAVAAIGAIVNAANNGCQVGLHI